MTQLATNPLGDRAVNPLGDAPQKNLLGDSPAGDTNPLGDSPTELGGPTLTKPAPQTVDDLFGMSQEELDAVRQKPQTTRGFRGVAGAAPAMAGMNPTLLAPPRRSLVGEAGAGLVRGIADIPQAFLSTALGLTQGAEEKQSVGRVFPEGPAPSRDDVAGHIANLVGGLVPQVAEGPVGFGATSYKSALERTDGNQLAAAGAGLTAAALGVIPFAGLAGKIPGLDAAVEKLGLGVVASRLAKTTVEALASGTANVGITASTEELTRLGGGAPEDMHLGEAFAVGAITHGLLATPKLLRTPFEVRQAARVREEVIKAKLFSPEEITLIGDRPELLAEIAKARSADKEVQVTPALDKDGNPQVLESGEARLRVRVTQDVVTQREKAALGFDQPMIDAYREHRKAGGKPFFVEPSRLPVSQEEAKDTLTKLQKLDDAISPTLDATDFGPQGEPLTERALVVRDARRLSDQLVEQPGSRRLVEQATALANTPRTSRALDPGVSAAALTSDAVLSPLDLRPVQAPWLPLPRAKVEGLLRPSSELSQRPATQRKLDVLKRKTMEELGGLQDSALAIEDKVIQTRQLDAKFVEKANLLLGKDNNNASGTRTKVVKAVVESKIAKKEQASVLSALDKAMNVVTEKFTNETQRGTLERLMEELADPVYGTSEKTFGILEALHGKMLSDENYKPWGERVQAAATRLREAMENFAGFGLEAGRDRVQEAVDNLPPGYSTPYLKAALRAQSAEELTRLAEQVAATQERYLRDSASRRITSNVAKSNLNPQRGEVLKFLKALGKGAAPKPPTPAEPATGQTKPAPGPTAAPLAAVRVGGEVFSHPTGNHETVMVDILRKKFGVSEDRARELLGSDKPPQNAQQTFATMLQNLPDSALGYERDGKFLSRKEASLEVGLGTMELHSTIFRALAEDIIQFPEGHNPAAPKVVEAAAEPLPEVVITNREGKVIVDKAALAKVLEALPVDVLQDSANRLQEIVRKGQIERRVYQKALKFNGTEDVQAAARAVNVVPKKDAGPQSKLLDAVRLFTRPVSTEVKLDLLAHGDKSNPIYSIFHQIYVEPMSRHLQNMADTRRFAAQVTRDVLGLETESVRGQRRLAGYLAEKLPSGLTRDKAMRAYAWSGDEGRKTDLKAFGVETEGKTWKSDEAMQGLTAKDRAFVDQMKEYFQNNPYMERAFSNVLLLLGHEPTRIKGYFPSARSPEKVKLEPDFGSFATTLLRDIDPLRDRMEGLDSPFNVDKGFYSTFLGVSDKLSNFAEMGRELFRSQSLLINKDFEQAFKQKFGKTAYSNLSEYLGNIGGQVGHSDSIPNWIVNRLTTGFTVSRVGLNVFSAAKQRLHVLTMMADGTLDFSALVQASIERPFLRKRLDADMQVNSGLAYNRYTGGQYMQHYLVLADEGKLPSRMSLLQYYGMSLQRAADRQVSQIAWRAAELTAKNRGLEGKEEVASLFNIAMGRDQPTDNPLYSTALEVHAKQNPYLRAVTMFAREQNRILGVLTRHVGHAVQEPTAANVSKAARALMFGLVGNAVGVLAINQVRRLVYDKDTTPADVGIDAISNVAGMWYGSAEVGTLVEGFIDTKRRAFEHKSPVGQSWTDLRNLVWGMGDSLTVAGDVKSGIDRGETTSRKDFLKGLDAGMSLTSTVLGLPFWALWEQGKGLYTWTDDDYRGMVHFEAERAQLKADGDTHTSRWNELERAKAEINRLHRLREAGLMDKSSAQSRIADEVRRVER